MALLVQLPQVLKRAFLWKVGSVLAPLLILAAPLLAIAILGHGTDALVALGLPRDIAAGITLGVLVASYSMGLFLFATKVIDW